MVTDIVDAGSVIVIGVPDIEVVRVTGGMIMISIEVRVVVDIAVVVVVWKSVVV